MTAPHPALGLALHWMGVGQPERALQELSRLPAQDATSHAAYLLRAEALHALDRDAEARQVAEAGIGHLGPEPGLLSVLGRARQALGAHASAERAFLDGLAVDPTDADLLCAYARLCLDVGQVEKADRLVGRAAEHEPESDAVARTRVLVEFVRGRDRDALAYSTELLRRDPDDVGGHALHGAVRAARGEVGPAAASMRRAAAAHPDDPDVVEAARELRVAAHPLLLPLRPARKVGALALWLGMIVTVFGLRAAGLPAVATVVLLLWVVFCVYSWVAPPLVRRLLRRR